MLWVAVLGIAGCGGGGSDGVATALPATTTTTVASATTTTVVSATTTTFATTTTIAAMTTTSALATTTTAIATTTTVPTTTTTTLPAAPKRLNVAYTARNGLTVTLTSFSKVDTGGYYNYTVTYTEKNNTTVAIDEGHVKLYLSNKTGMPQYGFFGELFPGDTQSGGYTFKVLYTDAAPYILEYDQDNFFADVPVSGSLQWTIPIPN